MFQDLVLAELKEIRNTVESMFVRQQFGSEVMRKSANSINVVIRLLAGVLHLNTRELANTLIKADALLHTAKSFEDSNINSLDFNPNEFPINHLKTLLLNLVKVIEVNEQNSRLLSPIHIPSTSSHTETSHIISIPTNTMSETANSSSTTQTTYSEAHNNDNNNGIPNVQIVNQSSDKPATATYDRQMSPDITQNTYSTVYNIQKNMQNVQKIINEAAATVPETHTSPDITQSTSSPIHNDNVIMSGVPTKRKMINKPTAAVSKTHISPDITQSTSSLVHNNNINVPTKQETTDEQNSAASKLYVSPDITQNTSQVRNYTTTVPNLSSKQESIIHAVLQMSSNSNRAAFDKRKEMEYELRRKYRNKYKYLNYSNKVQPIVCAVKNPMNQVTKNREPSQTAGNMKKRSLVIPKAIIQDQITKNNIMCSEARVVLCRYNPNENIEPKIIVEPNNQKKSAKPKNSTRSTKKKITVTYCKKEAPGQKSNNKVNSHGLRSQMNLRRSNKINSEREPALKKKRPNK